MNILSKFTYRFYCIKRQKKSKIRVQVKYKGQNMPFFSLMPNRMKNGSYLTQWHNKDFLKHQISFPLSKVNEL